MSDSVLITGAAQRVGRETALYFSRRGLHVWIHYRNSEDEALSLCEQIRVEGGTADPVQADLCSIADMDRMTETLRNSGRFPKLLIHNASVFERGRLSEAKADRWTRIMDTNLRSVWYLSDLFYREILTSGVGQSCIIMVGDANAAENQLSSLYGLSRLFLEPLCRQLAAEYAPYVRVNLAEPGYLMQGVGESESFWKSHCRDGAMERYLNLLDTIWQSDCSGECFRVG